MMLGVHYRQLGTTLVLIVASWGCFLSVCFHLHQNTHIVIGVLLCCLQIIFLLSASVREPGVIPRLSPISQQSTHLHHLTMDNFENLEYCRICNIFKLPRTKHCRYCDSCISGFDHHCPWIGSCIGVRNYHLFFLLLLSVVSGSLYINYTCIKSTILNRINASKILHSSILIRFSFVVILLFSVFISILVGAFLVFHCYLCCTQQTTQEFLKGKSCSNSGIPSKHIQLPLKKSEAICGLCEYNYYDTMLKPMWELDDDDDTDVEGGMEFGNSMVNTTQNPLQYYFSTPSASNSESDKTTLDGNITTTHELTNDLKTIHINTPEETETKIENPQQHHQSTNTESLAEDIELEKLSSAATKFNDIKGALSSPSFRPHTPPKKSTSLASIIASNRNSSGDFAYSNINIQDNDDNDVADENNENKKITNNDNALSF